MRGFATTLRNYYLVSYVDGAERWRWRLIWCKALDNMPAINKQIGTMGCLYGQQSALGHCLGYHSKRTHHAVYSGWVAGSKPEGGRADLLKKLATKQGALLAEELLKKRAHRYNIWPREQAMMGCFGHSCLPEDDEGYPFF